MARMSVIIEDSIRNAKARYPIMQGRPSFLFEGGGE